MTPIETRPITQGLSERQKRLVLASWWAFLVKEDMSCDDPEERETRSLAVALMKRLELHMDGAGKLRASGARRRYWPLKGVSDS
jgi:hypothetical protein